MGAKLTDEIKKQVQQIVDKFNIEHMSPPDDLYVVRFRGNHAYLDLSQDGEPSPLCRITFTGKMNEWDFAIYKFSDERYDPDEWMYPGAEDFDGTVESALQVGLQAYG